MTRLSKLICGLSTVDTGRRRQARARRLIFTSCAVWAFAAAVAAENIEFGPNNSKGVFFKLVVYGEGTDLILVPVDLEHQTFGKSIRLGNHADLTVREAPKLKGAGHFYYRGYYLEPGDYAVLGLNSSMTQAFRNIYHWNCYAKFSPILSVRAGDATIWRITPPTVSSWQEYSQILRDRELNTPDLEWFTRSLEGDKGLQPTKVRSIPSAFADFTGGAAEDPRDCQPRSLKIVYRVEDDDLSKSSKQP